MSRPGLGAGSRRFESCRPESYEFLILDNQYVEKRWFAIYNDRHTVPLETRRLSLLCFARDRLQFFLQIC